MSNCPTHFNQNENPTLTIIKPRTRQLDARAVFLVVFSYNHQMFYSRFIKYLR